MQLNSVLVVFCALALALASAEEYRLFRQKRVVAIVPGFSMMCALGGYCGSNYKNFRSHHPDKRYGPYYHNQYIPRHRDVQHVHHHHNHRGYYYGGH
ncbi:hypothetical protein QR680_002019 [Steinernema hermaphroditum]|uniref:Uncharacterized protein n=1 Tax=Steinernema hermaphroditum TaxID=289476 RepID=A0AA39LHB5_9BILA|nr:hypothetical protein QR680_002019 [Steinernema hermaphroditum]